MRLRCRRRTCGVCLRERRRQRGRGARAPDVTPPVMAAPPTREGSTVRPWSVPAVVPICVARSDAAPPATPEPTVVEAFVRAFAAACPPAPATLLRPGTRRAAGTAPAADAYTRREVADDLVLQVLGSSRPLLAARSLMVSPEDMSQPAPAAPRRAAGILKLAGSCGCSNLTACDGGAHAGDVLSNELAPLARLVRVRSDEVRVALVEAVADAEVLLGGLSDTVGHLGHAVLGASEAPEGSWAGMLWQCRRPWRLDPHAGGRGSCRRQRLASR
jgi:hypothetical protein